MRAIEHADDEREPVVPAGAQPPSAAADAPLSAAAPAAPLSAAAPAARSPIPSASSVADRLAAPPALHAHAAELGAADDAPPPPALRFHEFIVALAMGALLRVTPAITMGGSRRTIPPSYANVKAAAAAQAVAIVLDCLVEVWSFYDVNADGQIAKAEVWKLLDAEKKRLVEARGYRGRRESAASSEGPPDAAILSRERWEEMAGRAGAVQFREFVLAVTKWVEDEEPSESPLEVAPA